MPAAISVQAAIRIWIVSVFIHHSVWRWIKRGHTNTEKCGKLLKKESPSLHIFLKISKLTRGKCRSECVCLHEFHTFPNLRQTFLIHRTDVSRSWKWPYETVTARKKSPPDKAKHRLNKKYLLYTAGIYLCFYHHSYIIYKIFPNYNSENTNNVSFRNELNDIILRNFVHNSKHISHHVYTIKFTNPIPGTFSILHMAPCNIFFAPFCIYI